MKSFNLYTDTWDHTEERPSWRAKATRVGRQLNAELIGGGLYELEPGNKLWPYHTHHANEEWVIVLRGEPTGEGMHPDRVRPGCAQEVPGVRGVPTPRE